MCCWTVYDLQPPFPESTTLQATIAILQDRRPSSHDVTHEIPHSTWELMEQTWVRNPGARPTAAEIKSRLLRSTGAVTPFRSTTDSVSPLYLELSRPERRSWLSGSGNESASTTQSRPESDGSHMTTRQKLREARLQASARSTPTWSPHRTRFTPTPVPRPRTTPAAPRSAASASVRMIASASPGAERLVPQFVYRPAGSAKHLLNVADVDPIIFYVRGEKGCGISCMDALQDIFDDLITPDSAVESNGHMRLRVMWPDYEPWTSAVTVDHNATIADLAKLISSQICVFIQESYTHPLREGSRWRTGPGFITIAELDLVGLQPVAIDNWQVHLRVHERLAAPVGAV